MGEQYAKSRVHGELPDEQGWHSDHHSGVQDVVSQQAGQLVRVGRGRQDDQRQPNNDQERECATRKIRVRGPHQAQQNLQPMKWPFVEQRQVVGPQSHRNTRNVIDRIGGNLTRLCGATTVVGAPGSWSRSRASFPVRGLSKRRPLRRCVVSADVDLQVSSKSQIESLADRSPHVRVFHTACGRYRDQLELHPIDEALASLH